MSLRITQTVQIAMCICITAADAWTCDGKKRAFFGLTAHWITDALTRKSVALACRRFKGSHTYDKIADLIVSILKEYHIPIEKVVKAITDNGSNFLKAFREFSEENKTQRDDTEYDTSTDDEQPDDIENSAFLSVSSILEEK